MDGKFTGPDVEQSASVTLTTGGAAGCYKCGRLVMVVINTTTSSAASAWSEIGSVPTDYLPLAQLFFNNVLSAGSGFAIRTDGAIVTSSAISASQAIWATITYISKA